MCVPLWWFKSSDWEEMFVKQEEEEMKESMELWSEKWKKIGKWMRRRTEII